MGAVKRWVDYQNESKDVTYCIVDLHSITLPQNPEILRNNSILSIATLLACGLDPKKSTIFLQSDVPQHAELGWILGCLTTIPRLSHLPQFKEKSSKLKDIPLGLFVYPVLQSADILLYKGTHVPVGEDQVQHLQLAQHLAKLFNHRFGETFPSCHALIAEDASSRVKSLRDPLKKMSKSDDDPKSSILLTDKPKQIIEKFKKAITDFTSEVTYDIENRPGVSNLLTIHSLVSGKSIETIINEANGIDTGKYKLIVADAVIEHINPIREKIDDLMNNQDYLWSVLKDGSDKAKIIAEKTMIEVREKVGLGKSLRLQSLQKSKISI